MPNIVVAKIDKINWETTLEKAEVINSAGQLTTEQKTFVVDEQNFSSVVNKEENVYIPSTLLKAAVENAYVYFDLELYPYFQKAREIIMNKTKPEGVFRFRRTIEKDEYGVAAGDLYVLSCLFGEPEDIQTKFSRKDVSPFHIIVTVNFGEGTMAHLEYTLSAGNRVEMEWSGIKNIIEFDSDEMNPIDSKSNTFLPSAYSIDSILVSAQKVDQGLKNRLERYTKLINGGAD